MSKIWSWKKTGPSLDQNIAFSDNSVQNICNKMEKSSNTGQKKEKFGIYFCVLFNCNYQSLIYMEEDWALGYVSTHT